MSAEEKQKVKDERKQKRRYKNTPFSSNTIILYLLVFHVSPRGMFNSLNISAFNHSYYYREKKLQELESLKVRYI
jgi:hypothetical protein